MIPVVDEEELKTKDFPECCPQYDCEEGTDVVYAIAKSDDQEKPRSSTS